MIVSVTGFSNEFSNLIDFVSVPKTGVRAPLGRPDAISTSRAPRPAASKSGTTIDILPGLVKFNAAYTYLHAIDLATGLVLARRPKNLAALRAHHHADRQMADRAARRSRFRNASAAPARPARSTPIPASTSTPSTSSTRTGRCSRAAKISSTSTTRRSSTSARRVLPCMRGSTPHGDGWRPRGVGS